MKVVKPKKRKYNKKIRFVSKPSRFFMEHTLDSFRRFYFFILLRVYKKRNIVVENGLIEKIIRAEGLDVLLRQSIKKNKHKKYLRVNNFRFLKFITNCFVDYINLYTYVVYFLLINFFILFLNIKTKRIDSSKLVVKKKSKKLFRILVCYDFLTSFGRNTENLNLDFLLGKDNLKVFNKFGSIELFKNFRTLNYLINYFINSFLNKNKK